ncbi:MAG: transglutaminase domain-containing protein [Candidatus Bipolaricaulota bacterium]
MKIVLLTLGFLAMVCLSSAAEEMTPGPVLFALEGVLLQESEHTYTVIAAAGTGPSDVSVTISLPTSGGSLGHEQRIAACDLTADPALQSSREEMDTDGNRWFIAHWTDASGDASLVRRTRWLDETLYAPILTTSRYPIDPGVLPADALPWLAASAQVQSDAPAVAQLAGQLTTGAVMQIEVVARVLGWLHEHVAIAECDTPVPQIDALWTLENGRGICGNFSNLALALLRAAGIPSRPAWGYVADADAQNGIGHVWIDVFFPDLGWTEFESSPWVPSGAALVLEMFNNHFPETGVPATFLLPQHLTVARGDERGISGASFDEQHTASITEVERPREVTQAQADVPLGVAISWVLTLRSPSYYEVLLYEAGFGYADLDLTLSVSGVPAGWYACLSQTEVSIEKQWVSTPGPTRNVLLTVMPPATAPHGEAASIVVTATSAGTVVGTFAADLTVVAP